MARGKQASGLLTQQKVLRAAALTYIASFLLSLLQFLRLLAITGSRRD